MLLIQTHFFHLKVKAELKENLINHIFMSVSPAYYPPPYYASGPFGGPGFSDGRFLSLIGSGALLSTGNPVLQTVGALGFVGNAFF